MFPPIIQIGNVLLSSEILTERFCCDLTACKGECCIEGDAGAPVTLDEIAEIEQCVDTVWQDLSASAQAVIDSQGVAYTDVEGDLVTSIVGGKDCVFTCYGDISNPTVKNCCLCALEKAYREGKTRFCKPISCALYPIREKRLSDGLIGLNYNRWKVCKAAVELGRKKDLRLYQFLEQPLRQRFGDAWYEELCEVAHQLTRYDKIRVIAFDADDTLWDCQSHFEQVENHLYRLIAPYCDNPAAELFQTESQNMADLGYGCKAFTISIVETALRVGGAHIPADELAELLHHSKQLLHLPATPLPQVVETLERLQQQGRYRMVVFTKGELQDQENKLQRSGLSRFFSHVEITSDKSEREFRQLCEHLQIEPEELLMVGNSLKSDIAPALAIGAEAIHIPFSVTWQLEHFEEITHDRLVKIDHFGQLTDLL